MKKSSKGKRGSTVELVKPDLTNWDEGARSAALVDALIADVVGRAYTIGRQKDAVRQMERRLAGNYASAITELLELNFLMPPDSLVETSEWSAGEQPELPTVDTWSRGAIQRRPRGRLLAGGSLVGSRTLDSGVPSGANSRAASRVASRRGSLTGSVASNFSLGRVFAAEVEAVIAKSRSVPTLEPIVTSVVERGKRGSLTASVSDAAITMAPSDGAERRNSLVGHLKSAAFKAVRKDTVDTADAASDVNAVGWDKLQLSGASRLVSKNFGNAEVQSDALRKARLEADLLRQRSRLGELEKQYASNGRNFTYGRSGEVVPLVNTPTHQLPALRTRLAFELGETGGTGGRAEEKATSKRRVKSGRPKGPGLAHSMSLPALSGKSAFSPIQPRSAMPLDVKPSFGVKITLLDGPSSNAADSSPGSPARLTKSAALIAGT